MGQDPGDQKKQIVKLQTISLMDFFCSYLLLANKAIYFYEPLKFFYHVNHENTYRGKGGKKNRISDSL